MKTSESIAKISQALLNAQKKIKSVTKEADNPYFKSKYADLASVINACKEELNSEGITVLQPVDEMFVETILVHSSGEFMSARTPIVCKSQNNPQDLGSAITYARRYGIQSMIFLPAVDDDAELATEHKTNTSTVSSAPKTAPESSLGKCPLCGANNKKSSSTGKIYCSSMCWLPENQHLQTLSTVGLEK